EGMTVSYIASTLRQLMQQLNYSTEVPLSQREFQALLVEEEVDRLLSGMGVDVVALVDTADVIYEDMNKMGKSMTFENLVDTILNLRGKNTATVKDVKEQARVIKSMVQHTLNANGNKVMEEFQVLRTELAALREEALRRDEDEDAEADDFNGLGFQMEETEPFPANSRGLDTEEPLPGGDVSEAPEPEVFRHSGVAAITSYELARVEEYFVIESPSVQHGIEPPHAVRGSLATGNSEANEPTGHVERNVKRAPQQLGIMAEPDDANTAEKIPREREAWRRLLARVAQLRGYPKAFALLQEKHAELPASHTEDSLFSAMALPALLQCSGQIGSGPSWAEVRGNLSFYTAMNLASRDITVDTQSPRYWELLDVWRKIDGDPVLSQQASSQCPVGYLTLKLLGFVSLRAEVILEELLKLEGVMIHPILRCLASTLDWHKVADLGWPLFRLLARVESPAHEELGMTNPLNTWSEANWLSEMPYLELVQRHLDEGIAVPAAASGLLLSYPDRISPYSRATALLALAEVLRPPRVAPDLVGEAERLIRRAVYILTEDFLALKYPPLVPLTSRWPIFQLADRLACKGEVRWNLPSQAARSRPRVAVLPMPEKVSDVVRSCSLPYCDLNFFELVLRAVAASARKKLHLVEVGANLGDCTFWVAAHLGRRLTSATAVEPVPSAAAAVRRSVTINGWDFIQVVQAVAGAKAGQGSMHFLAHSAGNPYASASAVALRNVETPSVPARMTTVARLLSSQPRPGTARLLKLYAYADLLDVLKGARSAARKVDAVWLAFAAGLLPRARSAAVAMFAFFYRQGFRVALPSFEVDWCRSWRPRWVAEQKMRQWLAATQTSRSAHSMVYVVAFRPRVLHCKPWQSFKQHADETRVWDRAGIAQGCFFGRSRRQLLMAKRHGATYASYFLGDEELELEQQLDFFHDSDGDIHPPQLPFEDDDRAQRWFHRKLKSKDGSKIRAKLCNKLALQLQAMGHDLIGRDAIERVSEALTQGTAEEGPLVCSMLAKELEGTRFDHHWVSQDGKGRYRLGEDGMKVAVQVLDGKLLIHGYFEGSLVHPVRIPILAFLTEHGKTSEKQPEDDCDLFGQAAPATGEKEGGQIRLRSRSRSPRPSKVQEPSAPQSGPLPLPLGWVKKESRSKPGVFYYANEAKGLTQFERPTS
ncbi:unnamed protein product, partial [Symbiodinium necroappetens]